MGLCGTVQRWNFSPLCDLPSPQVSHCNTVWLLLAQVGCGEILGLISAALTLLILSLMQEGTLPLPSSKSSAKKQPRGMAVTCI